MRMVHAVRMVKLIFINAVAVTINGCKMPMVSNMVSMVCKRMGVPADIVKFYIVLMLGNRMDGVEDIRMKVSDRKFA